MGLLKSGTLLLLFLLVLVLLLLLLLLETTTDAAEIVIVPFTLLERADPVEDVMQRRHSTHTRIFHWFFRPQTSLVQDLVQLHHATPKLFDVQL